ncbi:MAG: hypothetical protein M3524_06930, partial [Actinomycetota bacterium]|nr:hypothetical protein [Actinomycetota bacterium]
MAAELEAELERRQERAAAGVDQHAGALEVLPARERPEFLDAARHDVAIGDDPGRTGALHDREAHAIELD